MAGNGRLQGAMLLVGLLTSSLSAASGRFSNSDIYTCIQPSWAFGFEYRPNCEGIARRAGREYHLSTNQYGLRDRARARIAAKGTNRILLVGPSVLVGPGIEEPETPPRQLERLLKKAHRQVEIVNGASDGYFTVRQEIRVPQLVSAYSPSHTVFFLQPTTVANDLLEDELAEYDSSGRPIRVVLPNLVFKLPWAIGIKLSEELRGRLNSIPVLLKRIRIAWRLRRAPVFEESAVSRTVEALTRIAADARQRGSDFLAVVAEDRGPVTFSHIAVPGYSQAVFDLADRFFPRPVKIPAEAICARLRARSVDCVTFDPQLTAELYIPGDWHLTPQGARHLAEGLGQVLSRQPWMR